MAAAAGQVSFAAPQGGYTANQSVQNIASNGTQQGAYPMQLNAASGAQPISPQGSYVTQTAPVQPSAISSPSPPVPPDNWQCQVLTNPSSPAEAWQCQVLKRPGTADSQTPTEPEISEAELAEKLRAGRSQRVNPTSQARISDNRQRGIYNVVQELRGHNYTVESEFILAAPNGIPSGQEVAYIRAINKGRLTYIEIDDPKALIGIGVTDLTAYEKKDLKIYSLSTKRGQLRLAGGEVRGIAIPNQNFLTIISGNSDDPIERTFIYGPAGSWNESELLANVHSGDPISYPILSLKDIRTKPATALAIVISSTNRLRRGLIENNEARLKQMKEDVRLLYNKINEINTQFPAYTRTICSGLTKLETMDQKYTVKPPTDERGISAASDVRVCLQAYNEILTEQIQAANRIGDERARIVQCYNDLSVILQEMQHSFSEIQPTRKANGTK